MPAPPSTSLPRRSTCPPPSPPNRDSARLTCNALIKATAQRIPDAALCSHAPTEDSPMKAQRTDCVRGAPLHRAVCAKLSRFREKAPRNPDLRPWPERETADQAPVPMHEKRRPAVQWWGVRSLQRVWTSTRMSTLLVNGV